MSDSSAPPHATEKTTLILLVLAVAGTAYALLQGAIAPAIPQFQRDLDVSINAATWILTALLLSASVSAPVVGRAGDLYGRKRVLILVLLIFALGTALSGFANSLPMMLVGRVLQGVGRGIFPLAFAIVRDILPRQRVPGAIGILSATLGVGGGLGIIASGLIVRYLDTSFLFWIPLGPILFSLIALSITVPAAAAPRCGAINWVAALLLALALTAILLALSLGRGWGWGSARTLALIICAAISAVAWWAVELRAKEPLIGVRLLTLRGVWTSNVVALLVGTGFYGAIVLTSQLLQAPESSGHGFGHDTLATGFFLLPMATMLLVTGLLTGRLERRFGARPLVIAGALATSGGFAFLALLHREAWQIVLANLFLGAGIGLCFAALSGVVVLAVPREHVGATTGMNTVVRTIGAALGTTLAGSILAGLIVDGTPAESAFVTAFVLLACIMLLATVTATLMVRR